METIPSQEQTPPLPAGEAGKKGKGWKIFFTLLFILLTTFLIVYYNKASNTEEELANVSAKVDELNKKLNSDNNMLRKETRRADSVQHIITRIKDYMPFAATLQYRDSLTEKLIYDPGDVVLLKPDSSKWVITNVNIRGGKWQHSVTYTLKDKTGKIQEVEPELLY